MKMNPIKLVRKIAASAALVAALGLACATSQAASPSIVIYELYGAGGNSGAILNADYAVLFNRGNTSQSINGWSIQYSSAGGASWSSGFVALPNATIPAGGYYCIQFAGGTNGTGFIADFTNTTINMAAAGGKLALCNNSTILTATNPLPSGAIVDFVGSAAANAYEGTGPTASATTTKILRRGSSGCTDTDSNTNDFALVTIAANYQPNYSVTAVHNCGFGTQAPIISSITPSASFTTNAGASVSFGGTLSQGVIPLTYNWYKIVGTVTNLVSSGSTPNLTLNNIVGGNAGGYQLIVSNTVGTSTSSVVTMTVTGDPGITSQPNSVQGLLDGTAQFSVTPIATSPTYQWYAVNGSGGFSPLSNITQPSGSVISGATSSLLTISNLQLADGTNFAVVVTDSFGSVTSSVVSLTVGNVASLAFWDFNGAAYSNNFVTPVPYIGNGTASGVGSVALQGNTFFNASVADGVDGAGFTTNLPNYAWGTSGYATNFTSNKLDGVQFLVSTVGAKDVVVSYDAYGSGTASAYQRLQYTTNGGTTWLDYPTSSFIPVASTFTPFTNDLTGFAGVANNPNFGFRIVGEFQSTATYGISTNTNYVGIANTYAGTGSKYYDIVNVTGVAITNNNQPPVVGPFVDTNFPDYTNITVNFYANDDSTSPDSLSYTAVSLNPTPVHPAFTFGGSGTNRTLHIQPNSIPDSVDAAPILITVTDANGDSTVTSFLLTLTSVNLPPTNTLAATPLTNMLANSTIIIPFKVTDDRSSASTITYFATSGNNTVISNSQITINGAGTTNTSLTIQANTNQLGIANISIVTADNDAIEPKSTTNNIIVMVRPNTNILAIDYFDYDGSGSLDILSGGYWKHLTGNTGQLQVGGGVATLDTVNNTENVQAVLLSSFPKTNNGGAVLYASFIVNVNPNLIAAQMPSSNGTYFAAFNDGSTANYEARVLAATNNAAAGDYRLFISNTGSSSTNAQMFPVDLIPGSNYVVVISLVLSNGFSTIWVNPINQSSLSATDLTTNTVGNLINVGGFALRENGGFAGLVNFTKLKVGTTFDSVLPSLQIQNNGVNYILNSSDPTLPIQSATSVTGPYTDVVGAQLPYTNTLGSGAVFFKFGQ